MEWKNLVLRGVVREDDGSVTLIFHSVENGLIITFPKEKIERIIDLYGATEKK